MAGRTREQLEQDFYAEKKVDPKTIGAHAFEEWLRAQPEGQLSSGIAQYATPENRESVANSEAEATAQEQQHRTDYDNAETNNDIAARDRAQAEAAEQRERAVYAQTSLDPQPMPDKRAMPTSNTSTPTVSTEQVDSFVDTSDLDTSEAEIEEPKKHDYLSTQVRDRTKKAATRVGKETNAEPETPPEPVPAPLPEEDLSEAGVTQEDIDTGNVDETNVDAAEGSVKENGFDPETADAEAIKEAEQLGTWDKVSIGLSVASSILSALTLGILPPIDFRKFKNTDQKLAQIQQYQRDKRDAAVINNLQKEAQSKGITDPQEIRQYVNDRFNSQSRNEQRTQDFNIQNKELDNKLAAGMKNLEHNLEMKKLDRQTINKIKEDTNNILGDIKKIYAQGDVNRKQTELEAKLKDWLAENQSAYDASTQADMFKYMANALKEMGVRVDLDNVRRAHRALQGASNTTSANLSIAGQSVGGASTN